MKNLTDYIDSFGMVITKSGDGGDSCAHGFAILYGKLLSEDKTHIPGKLGGVETYAKKLELEPGRYVRHPDKNKWYSSLDRLSRDQMIPLLVVLGLIHDTTRLTRLFKEHLKHLLLFTWNTRKNAQYPTLQEHYEKNKVDTWDYKWKLPDFTFMEIWSMWIRAYRITALYPLLCILDLENLFGSIKHRYFTSTDIQMNHVLATDFSTRIMPTPVSLLSRLIYGKEVPNWALTNKWGKLEWEPPIDMFLLPIVNKWPVRD